MVVVNVKTTLDTNHAKSAITNATTATMALPTVVIMTLTKPQKPTTQITAIMHAAMTNQHHVKNVIAMKTAKIVTNNVNVKVKTTIVRNVNVSANATTKAVTMLKNPVNAPNMSNAVTPALPLKPHQSKDESAKPNVITANNHAKTPVRRERNAIALKLTTCARRSG